jgi:sugar phosphate permease
MREFWHLVLLWGVVVGLGAGGVGSVLSATVANRWFMARRGLVLGILNSASSTGQLIFIPLLMAVIVYAGWRAGSLMLVAVVVTLIPLVFFWMRDDPADVGLEPYGSGEQGAASSVSLASLRGVSKGSGSVPLSEVFSSSTFWFLAGSFFICGATSGGLIGVHLIPYSIDQGIPEVTAAATVGIMGGLNFVGTVFAGWAVDRVAARKLLAVVYALRGVSLFILPFVTSVSGLFLFAVIYGLDWFASVPPTITLTADSFGKRSVGSVFGWVFLSHQIGAAFAASAAGVIRVSFGDYQWAFIGGGVLAMVGACLALLIRTYGEKTPLPSVAPEMVRA